MRGRGGRGRGQVSDLARQPPSGFCRHLGQRIAARAPLAVEVAKRIVNRGVDRGEAGYGVEAVAMLYGTRDADEGTAAFAERREPRFEGR